MITDAEWEQALKMLDESGSIAVCCHISPDGDALGSMLGLGGILRRTGKKVWMSWGSEDVKVPSQYSFLPGSDSIVGWEAVPEDLDLFVAIDCGDISRLELLKGKFEGAANRLNIDHHISNPKFAELNLVDPGRASSSEIAFELVNRMGGEVTPAEATCFYTGIVTDTGRFQYSNTSPRTLRIAAELREIGVDHTLVAEEVFESASFKYLQILGSVLAKARLDNGIVWSWLTQADLAEIAGEETDHFIDTLRSIKQARVAFLLKEHETGKWKVSLRSRGEADVSRIAQSFGGGGHQRAAGFTIAGDLEEVSSKVRKAAEGSVNNGS